MHSKPPQADGLYDPSFEHDACGVAMVARLDNAKRHEVVERALEALENLEHRGAEGADVRTGDGAGILVQLPDAFFRAVGKESAVRTCNSSVAKWLRLAGVKTSLWPPFAQGLVWRYRSQNWLRLL